MSIIIGRGFFLKAFICPYDTRLFQDRDLIRTGDLHQMAVVCIRKSREGVRRSAEEAPVAGEVPGWGGLEKRVLLDQLGP